MRLLPHSKPRTGGRGSFLVIDVGVGLVHSKSVVTLRVTSASAASQASNQISIWTVWGPAPVNWGLPATIRPPSAAAGSSWPTWPS